MFLGDASPKSGDRLADALADKAEHPLAKELIDRSFLSDSLKQNYWLSYKYRRVTLTFA